MLQCEDRMNFDLFKYNIGTSGSGASVQKVEPMVVPLATYEDYEDWSDVSYF